MSDVELSYPIQPCSPKARERIVTQVSDKPVETELTGKTQYPFNMMQIGECFIVRFDDKAVNAIRVRVSERNRKGDKRFTVLKHDEYKCLEIARIE